MKPLTEQLYQNWGSTLDLNEYFKEIDRTAAKAGGMEKAWRIVEDKYRAIHGRVIFKDYKAAIKKRTKIREGKMKTQWDKGFNWLF